MTISKLVFGAVLALGLSLGGGAAQAKGHHKGHGHRGHFGHGHSHTGCIHVGGKCF